MTKSVLIPTLAVAFRRCVLTMVLTLAPCLAYGQLLGNASFDVPAVTANTDSLRPTGATWAFTGQAGIRNNSAPNGSDGKQAAFLSAAPSGGNNNFGSVRQSISLKPGTYFVRYLAAVKTPAGRPQPLQFYVNGAAVGSVLNPRYLTDTTTGGFEAGWTQPFIVSTAGNYELRFDATNATNYGTAGAPLYATAYIDNIIVASVPGALANAGLEAAGSWTLSSGATIVAATDAPEGGKVLTLAASATAAQTISLPEGRYSLSVKLGKASVASGTLNVEIASNGGAAATVASITATTAAEYRTFTTQGFALPSGNHVVTLRATGSSFSLDNLVLNDAAPDAANAGFETPVLASPSSATAAGTVSANPAGASWTFSGTGGQIQTNAGSSNTSAPRTIAGKQYLGLSGTGAIAQSLNFAGGTYVAIAQVAQGGVSVRIDGTNVARLSSSTLDFREVMSAPFTVTAGSHSLGFAVDTTFSPATPKVDEVRLLRVDTLPAVSITSPANGTVFQTGATVNVTATASDVDGLGTLVIARTPAGGAASQLASGTASPLSTSWSNASANTYTLTATATDSTGATNAASITIRVNANPNTIASMSPSGPVVTSATAVSTTLSVTSATDSDGSVTKVEFLLDGTLVTSCSKTIPPATAPYTCAVSLAPRATAYALTARVTDNDGGVTTTAPFSLRVNTAPTVSLAAACVAPCTAAAAVNLTATPADGDGSIAKVEFYDGATLLGSKTAAPWTFAASGVASGSHSYTAKAFDNDGATTTSSAQPITVGAAVPTLALAASCTAPCNAPASVALTATASNITGTVSKVEFYDGATLLNSDTTSPYAFTATSVAAATHAYSAKVYVTGNTVAVATSATQNVRVNALPTVTLAASCVAPCANPATVNLTATPADADGTIAKVDFYDGATLLGSKTAAPWTFAHSAAAAGSHSYTAKAFDNDNASTTSTAQAVTVAAGLPAVALVASCTAPCNAPATVSLTATPSNISGTIAKVEFYDGTTLINTDTTSPYSYSATSVGSAVHSYTAKVFVTGNTIAVATSAAQAVRVNALPTVTLAASCVAPCAVSASVDLAASPTDTDGTISRVEFFDGTALLGTRSSAPWTFTHNNAVAGIHNYTAKAFDNDLASRTSTVSKVTVASTAPPSVTLTVACEAPCEAPATLTMTAVPANISGGTSYVQFANGMVWIDPLGGYGNAEPDGSYTYRLTNAAVGSYVVSATAFSNSFAQTTSNTVTIAVKAPANSVPAVNWLSPPNFSAINPLGTFTLSVAANDVDGSVSTVAFYVNGQWLGNATPNAGVYQYTWNRPDGNGPFQVRAIATDNLGKTATSDARQLQISDTIVFAPMAPPVYYVSPSGTTDISIPADILPTPEDVQGPTWQWTVSNQFNPWLVSLVEDNVVVDTQKYGYEKVPVTSGSCFYVWSDPGIDWCIRFWAKPIFVRSGKTIGSNVYSLRIERAEGVTWQSADSVIAIADPKPRVSITSPASGAAVFEGAVNITVAASALSSIGYLYLYEGSDNIGGCIVTSGACTFNWRASPGSHSIVARVTDSMGRTGSSTPVVFTVLPNQLPTVLITTPAAGATYREPADIVVTATARDPDGSVSKVQFYDGNNNLLGDGLLSNGVYSYQLSGVTAADRLRQNIRARATDDRGATGDYDVVVVNVVGAPWVELGYLCDVPCFSGGVALRLTSNYAPTEFTRIRVIRDGTEIAVLSQWQGNYVDANVAPGVHAYQVEVTTRWAEVALSVAVNVTVDARQPKIYFDPAMNATYPADQLVPLRVIVTEGSYPVSKVEFFVGNATLLGQATRTGDTFVLQWTGMNAGGYALTARVTDTQGHTASTQTNITITPGGPQAAAIALPIDGSEHPAGQALAVVAGGAGADAAISRIELWRVGTGASGGDELLGSAIGSALAHTLVLPATTELVQIYTVAYNAGGGRTQSALTRITARADISDPRYFVWTNFNAALKAGNKAEAMKLLTPTAQENYSAAIDLVISQIGSYVQAVVSPLVSININNATADYLIARDINGSRVLYELRFVLTDDGKWKIDSM